MHDHIVKSYDEEQRRLHGEILRMGEIAAAQLDAALDVVDRRDDKAAERIVANDDAIDALEHEVEPRRACACALRGPLARDLRESSPRCRSPRTSSASATTPRTWPSARSR